MRTSIALRPYAPLRARHAAVRLSLLGALDAALILRGREILPSERSALLGAIRAASKTTARLCPEGHPGARYTRAARRLLQIAESRY